MVCSMTGYGYSEESRDDISLTVELRAVNHRYLDLFFRIPREMQQWEEKLRSSIKNKLARGRIEVSINIRNVPEDVFSVKVNSSLLSAYNSALKDMQSMAALQGEISLGHILKFSDILLVENNLANDERIEKILMVVLDRALENLVSQRKREGGNLKKDLLERCSLIEEHVGKLQAKVPEVNEIYRKKLYQKLQDIEGGFFDESRILTECAVFVERGDINEELVRIKSHVSAFKDSVETMGAVGRKLDFILQEMFREINTIGSKSNDFVIAGLVVEVKTELEKMREQVQNIE